MPFLIFLQSIIALLIMLGELVRPITRAFSVWSLALTVGIWVITLYFLIRYPVDD